MAETMFKTIFILTAAKNYTSYFTVMAGLQLVLSGICMKSVLIVLITRIDNLIQFARPCYTEKLQLGKWKMWKFLET